MLSSTGKYGAYTNPQISPPTFIWNKTSNDSNIGDRINQMELKHLVCAFLRIT